MRGFIGGMLVSAMLQTPEGKKIANTGVKLMAKMGDKALKSQFNIDVKAILNDVNNVDVQETNIEEKEVN